MTLAQFLTILGALGVALAAFITGMFVRKKTAAEAKKSDAEATQIKVKTVLDIDSTQIEHVTGLSETIGELLTRAQKQSEEISDLTQKLAVAQIDLKRASADLEESRKARDTLEAINRYQREETATMRQDLLGMAERSNARQGEVDKLKAEMVSIKEELAQARKQYEECMKRHEEMAQANSQETPSTSSS